MSISEFSINGSFVYHGIPELHRWGTKLYSQVSHSHHSHRCGCARPLGFGWIHKIFEGNLSTEHSCYFGLGVIYSGDEVVVVVVVVAVFVFVFWDMLRHWHFDVRTVWVVLISLPAAPIWPCVLPGTDHHDERQTGCGGIQKSFRQTHGLLLAGLSRVLNWLLNTVELPNLRDSALIWFELIWYCTGICIDSILSRTVPTTTFVECDDAMLQLWLLFRWTTPASWCQWELRGDRDEEKIEREGDVDLLFVNVFHIIVRIYCNM